MFFEGFIYRSERWMYRNGHPSRAAVALNGWWAIVGRAGLWRRLVTLEVSGRATGRTLACPLILVRLDGRRYLVSMLGERAQWVRNVRAAQGRAVLRHGRREDVLLVEVPPADRAAIVKRHLAVAPAARSFAPIDHRAPVEDFQAFAAVTPVFEVRSGDAGSGDAESVIDGGQTAPGPSAVPPKPRRRWLRRLVIGLVAIAVLTELGVAAYLKTSETPPLALPASVAVPAGDLATSWTAASGSTAGFRIQQTVLGLTGSVAGRTNGVSGSASIDGRRVTAATFTVDLGSIKASGKPSRAFEDALDTSRFPTATFKLTGDVPLTAGFVSGDTLSTPARGDLMLRGVTRAVTASVAARRDGAKIDVAGSIPITFADWGIRTPDGFGALGSLADRGSAEFLLVLTPEA